MKAKDIVKNLYKSDALRDSQMLGTFLHPDVSLDWHSSKGFLHMNKEEMLNLADELKKSYESSRIYINHLLEEDGVVTVRIFTMLRLSKIQEKKWFWLILLLFGN